MASPSPTRTGLNTDSNSFKNRVDTVGDDETQEKKEKQGESAEAGHPSPVFPVPGGVALHPKLRKNLRSRSQRKHACRNEGLELTELSDSSSSPSDTSTCTNTRISVIRMSNVTQPRRFPDLPSSTSIIASVPVVFVGQ